MIGNGEIGRISGPLLKDNLLRNNVDLAFETDLLYLDTNHTRIGVHTAGPTRDLTVVGTTNVGQDITVDNPVKIGNILFGENSNDISTITGSLTISATNIYAPKITTDGLQIATKVISSLVEDSDVVIEPDTSLNIRSDTGIDGDLEVTGTIKIDQTLVVYGNLNLGSGSEATDEITFDGTLGQDLFPTLNNRYELGYHNLKWSTVYLGTSAQTTNIKIYDTNKITTRLSDTALFLYGKGASDAVKIEELRFYNNSISTVSDNYPITFSTESSGSVIIDTTTAIKIPVGTNSNYPVFETGDLRFSTTDNRYQGYGDANITFGGVFSDNKNTYILPESYRGANDNIITFVIDGSLKATITTNLFNTSKMIVDSIVLTNDTISTVSSSDITINSNGNGSIIVDDISFQENTITNTNLSDSLTLSTTGYRGYVKIDNTTGMVIPTGDSISRPLLPPIGTTRYNTVHSYLETFDGTDWYASNNPSPPLAVEDAAETMFKYTMILGS